MWACGTGAAAAGVLLERVRSFGEVDEDGGDEAAERGVGGG
jgi:hypothetical protein